MPSASSAKAPKKKNGAKEHAASTYVLEHTTHEFWTGALAVSNIGLAGSAFEGENYKMHEKAVKPERRVDDL